MFIFTSGTNAGLLIWMLLIGVALFVAGAFWGLAKVSEWVFPFVGRAALTGLGLYVAGILPLSLVREWRPGLAGAARFITALWSIGLWMVSFLLLWRWIGLLAAPAALIAPLAAPLAVIGSVFRSEWDQAAGLILSIAIASGMRSYAAWLAPAAGRPSGFGFGSGPRRGGSSSEKGDVIETVVVETRVDDPGEGPRQISKEDFK